MNVLKKANLFHISTRCDKRDPIRSKGNTLFGVMHDMHSMLNSMHAETHGASVGGFGRLKGRQEQDT
jgi:hypothetical protein